MPNPHYIQPVGITTLWAEQTTEDTERTLHWAAEGRNPTYSLIYNFYTTFGPYDIIGLIRYYTVSQQIKTIYRPHHLAAHKSAFLEEVPNHRK